MTSPQRLADGPHRFVEVFRLAALQAGAVAARMQGHVEHRRKPGPSPESEALTLIDLAAQDVLLLALREHFPDVAVDAEENTETVALFAPADAGRALVVVDPIDGTLNYIRHSRDYAVMGAWLERGRFEAAVVRFPALAVTLWAIRGRGCWRAADGEPPEPARIGAPPRRVLLTPGTARRWRAAVEESGWEVCVSRCSAIDSTAPVLGRAAAAVTSRPPDRRRAIGFLITTEAGGAVRIGDAAWDGEDPGAAPCSRIRPHVVAASDAIAQDVLAAVGSDCAGRGA